MGLRTNHHQAKQILIIALPFLELTPFIFFSLMLLSLLLVSSAHFITTEIIYTNQDI